MPSQNNDNGATTGLAFVITGIAIAAMLLFALLAFVALVFTILAVLAWDKPFKLGKITIAPSEARAFVYRGVIGAAAVPAFAAFASVLFDAPLDWDQWLLYFVVGGYAAGSIGVELLMGDNRNPEPGAAPLIVPPSLPKPQAPQSPSERPECPNCPFVFASWDDEEAQR